MRQNSRSIYFYSLFLSIFLFFFQSHPLSYSYLLFRVPDFVLSLPLFVLDPQVATSESVESPPTAAFLRALTTAMRLDAGGAGLLEGLVSKVCEGGSVCGEGAGLGGVGGCGCEWSGVGESVSLSRGCRYECGE
jgi:hypothetical protein